MSQPNVYKTVQLTATGSTQNLLAALQAVDSSILAAYREVNLQGDPGNSSFEVFIGDDQTSPTRYGVALSNGQSRNYRESGFAAGVPVANMYFLASGGSPKLNVELVN